MTIKLLTEHYLEFLSLKGGCTGSSESTHVKMPHCWKSHVRVHMILSYLISTQAFMKAHLGDNCVQNFIRGGIMYILSEHSFLSSLSIHIISILISYFSYNFSFSLLPPETCVQA